MRGIVVALWIGAGCSHHNGKKLDGGVDAADAAIDAGACASLTPPQCSPSMAPTTPATGSAACNVLAQTGCAAAQKCTWIEDSATLGHIGCAPDGVVELGCTCHRGAFGATGYDDCGKGSFCFGTAGAGVCKAICDPNGGAPACGTGFACSIYSGLFGPVGGPYAAGLCDPNCDPLADNDFLGSGSKPGCICTAPKTGCYGLPSGTDGKPTTFTCVTEVNPSLVNRSACTKAAGCADAVGNAFLNGCAQGYIPFFLDGTGSTQVDCAAMCQPGNTYLGNPGAQHPAGISPHACTTTDARGVFNPATTTTNGDHCVYSWLFEIDTNGTPVRSPTSDTVGFCMDFTRFGYDPNGAVICTSPTTPAGCVPLPRCASLPLTAAGSAPKAGDFGCVDSHTAGFPLSGKARLARDLRRP